MVPDPPFYHDCSSLPRSVILTSTQLVYANSPFYWTNQLCAKLSILLLYSRIFSVNTAYRWWIIGIAVVHILFSIAVLLVALFGCQPISKGWNPPLPGSCVTTAPGHFLAGTESINSGIDFAMVILAIFMIRELNMGTSKKLKISVLFAIGGLCVIPYLPPPCAFRSAERAANDKTEPASSVLSR